MHVSVVMSCTVCPASATHCCWPFLVLQVLAFNGTPILNLQHLAELVSSCQDTHLRFDCEYYETVVLDRQQAEAGTADVLRMHNIPAAMSADLQQALKLQWPSAAEKVVEAAVVTSQVR